MAEIAKPDFIDRLKSSSFGQFLGSDVYVGYTARYVWQANQLGHFALGFAISHVLYWIVIVFYWLIALTGWYSFDCSPWTRPCGAIGGWIDVGYIPLVLIVLFVLVYFGKEYADYVLAKRTYGATFPIDKVEKRRIRCDGIIDAAFVALGALLVVIAPPAVFVPLAIGGGIAYLVRRRELVAKDFLDRANLPFFYALPVFVRKLNRSSEREQELAASIRQFGRGAQGAAKHILIAGPKGSGKTCLAAAIAAELAINRNNVLFHSYTALLEANPAGAFKPGGDFSEEDGRPNHWGLADVNYLVIDEVPPAFAVDEIRPILDDMPKALWELIKAKKIHTVWSIGLPTSTPGGAEMPLDVDVIRIWGEALAHRLGTEFAPTAKVSDQPLLWVRLMRPLQKGAPRVAI